MRLSHIPLLVGLGAVAIVGSVAPSAALSGAGLPAVAPAGPGLTQIQYRYGRSYARPWRPGWRGPGWRRWGYRPGWRYGWRGSPPYRPYY